jgi:hypothetical protein
MFVLNREGTQRRRVALLILKDLIHDLYDYPHTNALFATFTTVSVNKYGC